MVLQGTSPSSWIAIAIAIAGASLTGSSLTDCGTTASSAVSGRCRTHLASQLRSLGVRGFTGAFARLLDVEIRHCLVWSRS
ncbi:hypothetical protein M758_12G056200 [Ceratodon purpureus]|nr:hypothetical protein M758_12G056200 [Ceratodon purpureus]